MSYRFPIGLKSVYFLFRIRGRFDILPYLHRVLDEQCLPYSSAMRCTSLLSITPNAAVIELSVWAKDMMIIEYMGLTNDCTLSRANIQYKHEQLIDRLSQVYLRNGVLLQYVMNPSPIPKPWQVISGIPTHSFPGVAKGPAKAGCVPCGDQQWCVAAGVSDRAVAGVGGLKRDGLAQIFSAALGAKY